MEKGQNVFMFNTCPWYRINQPPWEITHLFIEQKLLCVFMYIVRVYPRRLLYLLGLSNIAKRTYYYFAIAMHVSDYSKPES